MWGLSLEVLGNVKCPFIAFTPRSTLIRSSSKVLSMRQIELLGEVKLLTKSWTCDNVWGWMYTPSCTSGQSSWLLRCCSCLGTSLPAQHHLRGGEGCTSNRQTLVYTNKTLPASSAKHVLQQRKIPILAGRRLGWKKSPINIQPLPSNMEYKNNAG